MRRFYATEATAKGVALKLSGRGEANFVAVATDHGQWEVVQIAPNGLLVLPEPAQVPDEPAAEVTLTASPGSNPCAEIPPLTTGKIPFPPGDLAGQKWKAVTPKMLEVMEKIAKEVDFTKALEPVKGALVEAAASMMTHMPVSPGEPVLLKKGVDYLSLFTVPKIKETPQYLVIGPVERWLSSTTTKSLPVWLEKIKLEDWSSDAADITEVTMSVPLLAKAGLFSLISKECYYALPGSKPVLKTKYAFLPS